MRHISGVVVHDGSCGSTLIKKTNQYGSSGFITQDRLQQPCDSLRKSHAIPWSKSNHSSPSCLAEPVGSGRKQRDINIDDHDNVGLWLVARFAIVAIFPKLFWNPCIVWRVHFCGKKIGRAFFFWKKQPVIAERYYKYCKYYRYYKYYKYYRYYKYYTYYKYYKYHKFIRQKQF